MNIQQNIDVLQQKLSPYSCKLIAVSKTYPAETVMAAYVAGQRAFGENKVQEMTSKYEELPKDIEWHQIGHLQRNKVKYIAPFVSLIHSVDSLKLLKEINKEAKKNDRVIDCLFQMHIAKEESKFGLSEEEVLEILNSQEFQEMKHIRITGLMGMATNTDNEQVIRGEFSMLKKLFDTLKTDYKNLLPAFQELSMGMSSDYKIAAEEGSTMVRIGSAIFGKRVYQN
ncbi:YggS family pyridoxal phosphate-dependent enzyme [Cytophagaceae bacterium ABcell3]|nr:YggS family pyridoxal phosphate-dependent enzyme [Cytophagaceae bacterium ABcell3]